MSAECSAVNIPLGYKQTEVGVIPEDWRPVMIGDITIKVGSGITPRGGSSNYKEYGRPFVRSQNVGWGILLLTDLVYIDEDTHKSFSSTELRQGDVLLNITGASIGRCAVADARLAGGNVNQHVCIIRTDSTEVDSYFLKFILLSALGQQQIDSFQAGGNREGLNFGQIRSIKLPLPPTKAEQEAIAEALSDADAFIESLEQLILKKRQIKQGAMQELPTGKRRLPGFGEDKGYKQTDVGVIPDDWEVTKLIESAKVIDSLHQTPSFNDDGFPMVRVSDIKPGDLDLKRTLKVCESVFAEFTKNYKPKRCDIVLSRVGSYGISSFVETDELFCMGQNTVVIEPKVPARLLYYILNSSNIRQQIEDKSFGTGYRSLSLKSIKELKISLPTTLAEQTAIASILSDMDSEITSLEEKLAKVRQTKQGMMQELLTGRIRLI